MTTRFGLAAAVLVGGLGCKSTSPADLVKGCGTTTGADYTVDSVKACLKCSAGKFRAASGPQLKSIVDAIISECLPPNRNIELGKVSDALPFPVITHVPTGRTVVLAYFSLEGKVGTGRVMAILQKVSAQECCASSAIPLWDAAWGVYRGCSPAELSSDFQKKHTRCDSFDLADAGPL
jgi:hypothetical protein